MNELVTDAALINADLERGYRALIEKAGLLFLDDRLIIRVTGDDRVAFFHGMCSNDVRGARPGAVVPALFLTEHAHVLGECFLWVEPEALLVETTQSFWPRVRQQLERLLVADDVEMEEAQALSVLHIEGPCARDMLKAAGFAAASLEPWTFTNSPPGLFGRVARSGNDGFSLLGERKGLDDAAARLKAGGAEPMGAQALDVIRVENGLARAGIDTTEKTLALEARLERAISFNKGCYVGQETIERATARGGLKKKLYGLLFPERTVESGAVLLLDGKEVGRVTSPVVSPRFGAIGLAILHHGAWQSGLRLVAKDATGETGAVVSELPFGQKLK